MQIHPLLLSIAAPVAAKTAQAVAHTAQQVGQNFLQTLGGLGSQIALPESGEPALGLGTEHDQVTADSLHGELLGLSHRLRNWLAERGVEKPFELKFSVDAAGNEISNVVGPQSEHISDLIHADRGWLEQLNALTRKAQDYYRESSFANRAAVQLAISSEDAWILTSPAVSV